MTAADSTNRQGKAMGKSTLSAGLPVSEGP
jgi:hypothetical protein